MKRFLIRLRRANPLAFWALWVLAVLYLLALCADVVAPYPYDLQMRDYSLAPPTRIRFVDASGKLHLRPFVYGVKCTNYALASYEEDTSTIYPIRILVRRDGARLLGIPVGRVLFGVDAPGKLFLLGADMHGRDIFSRVIHGARISLSIGLLGVGVSFCLGLLIGGIAGYSGGMTDTLLMRLVEVVMTFPSFYLMLALRAAFPPKLTSLQVYLLIVVILSCIGWAGLARVIRGMVLSLKEEEYVLAGRALGLSSFRIIVRHIIPNTFSYTVTALTLSVPGYILGESALSLLGLGIQEPYPSWGNMLSVCIGNLRILTMAPWMLMPGLFIFITVISFNLLGDGLRNAMDPKNW